MKRPYTFLVPDGNSPGLRVCVHGGCRDELDPYRLPARQTDPLTLQYPRPDISIGVRQNGLGIDAIGMDVENGDGFLVTQDGQGYFTP
jgi:hypothetical protein